MRWKLAALLLLIAIVICGAARSAFNPLRRSDAAIRAWLLTATPLGSNREKVQATLDKRGWHDGAYQTAVPLPATEPFLGGGIGGYQGLPWRVNVSAFWEFDERGRLSGIRIQRIIDSP
jgi:hypothetical protein